MSSTATPKEHMAHETGAETDAPPNYASEAHGLEVLDLARVLANAAHDTQQAQRVRVYLIIWVAAGSGRLSVDDRDMQVQGGDAVVLHPGQAMRWNGNNKLEGSIVRFHPAFLYDETHDEDPLLQHDILHNAHAQPRLRVGKTWQPALRSIVHAMRLEQMAQESQHAHHDMQQHLLHIALILLQRALASRHKAMGHALSMRQLFCEFRHEVECRCEQGWTVQDYATALHVTPRTLSAAVQAAMGCSTKQYLDERTMDEARRLLRFTTHPISYIATRLHYSDASNFTKFFVRHAHVSPLEYRETAKEQDTTAGRAGG